MTPVIDGIDRDNFKFNYQAAAATNVGGFDWSMTFTWHLIPNAEQKRRQFKHYLPARYTFFTLISFEKIFFYFEM